MDISQEAYSNWYNDLTWIIGTIASKRVQEEIWIKKTGSKINDYEETTNIYFCDLDLDSGLKYKVDEGYLTQKESEILKSFHEVYNDFIESDNDRPFTLETMGSPEWTKVTKLAKATLEKLKKNNRK